MSTPKRPEATWRIRERRLSPFGSGVLRRRSSPPSPEFDRPPIRFIATASVSCASGESAPRLIAPVEKRLTMSSADSTSWRSYGVSDSRSFSSPRRSAWLEFSSLTRRLNSS